MFIEVCDVCKSPDVFLSRRLGTPGSWSLNGNHTMDILHACCKEHAMELDAKERATSEATLEAGRKA